MLIRRLYRIFLRYAEVNLALDAPGAPGTALPGGGQVTALCVRGGRLVLEGTSPAAAIRLDLDGVGHPGRPDPQSGAFRFDVPFQTGPLTLAPEGAAPLTLPGFTGAQVTRARIGLGGRFLGVLVTLVPQIWRWKRGGDLGAREEVKEALNLVNRPAASLLDPDVLNSPGIEPDPDPEAVLVMPVYNAFDMVQEALGRVARHSGANWRLVLVEDASSDARVRPWLRDWAARQGARVTLIEAARNGGFIAAVNRGLAAAREMAPDTPVVLLNSDAMVPVGWLPRLLAPLAEGADVASVTPLSNDAEICTVPVICARHDLGAGQGCALDAAARDLGPGAARPVLPTGVGFCMALAPPFLAQVPAFDTAFGRGYGEEVDWCQKTRALGGRHVCAQDLFVEHRGGASFGSADKQALLERNGARITGRYPRYDGEVQAFLRADPLTTPRLALALSWAGLGDDEVPVYLAHAMGGGAEDWLRDQIALRTGQGRAAVVLRVGQGRRWRLEVHGPQGVTAGLTDDADLVARLIGRLPRRRVIYSCGVGHADPAALPDLLIALAGGPEGAHPVEVLIHDFFPLSPSYTLLGADGLFHGVPVAGTDQGGEAGTDPAHTHRTPEGHMTDLATWQAAWGRLMARAARVVTFSQSSRDIVMRVYPEAEGRIEVTPHALRQTIPAIPRPKGTTPPTLGVLGNIGAHKGAGVLRRLSRQMAASGNGRLVVLGHLDPDFALAAPSVVHGAYRLEDLPALVARYGITGWFMPSIWPETFSFTTHEMLATGLPVAAFDLGAQGEAVARAVARGAPGLVVEVEKPDKPVDPARLLAMLERQGLAGREGRGREGTKAP